MGRDFFTVSTQVQAFLLSMAIGTVIGVLYDVFRIFRLSFTDNKVVVVIQDILFWSVSAVLSFLFVFVINNGEFRAFLAFGEILGFIVYYFTLGAMVFKISGWLIHGIKTVARAILRALLFPFRKIYLVFSPKLKSMCKSTKKNLKKSTSKCKFSLKRNHFLLYNKPVNK